MISTPTTARKMPGPQKTLRLPPFSKKKPKVAALRIVSCSDSEDENKASTFLWRKKVRLICTDPDATDSSSDEEMEDRRSCPKRLVREVFIPAHVDDEASLFSVRSHELMTQSPSAGSSLSSTSATSSSPKKASLKKKPASLKKSKGIRKPSHFVGVRQRRRGKWAAEIRDTTRGIRLWLGTFDNPLAAAKAYEMASKKLRGSLPPSRELESSDQSSFTTVSGNISQFEKEEKDITDDGPALSANSTDSILSEEHEPVSSCSDLECNMKSPSSVLEDPISSGSEGCIDSVSYLGMSTGSVLIDDYNFNDVKSVEAFQPLASQDKLECVDIDADSVLAPPFLEENCYGDLRNIFDINVLGDNGGNELLNAFEDDLLADDGDICDISFDLDTECLQWIDVPEACR